MRGKTIYLHVECLAFRRTKPKISCYSTDISLLADNGQVIIRRISPGIALSVLAVLVYPPCRIACQRGLLYIPLRSNIHYKFFQIQ